MAFSSLPTKLAGEVLRASYLNQVKANEDDHQSRIVTLEGGVGGSVDLATEVTGALPLANLPTNFAQMFKATVTLTDAQVKALPTTPITIVAAPGSGFVLTPLRAVLMSSFAAGAYTNIDAGASMWINVSNIFSQYLVNDVPASETLVTDFLGSTTKKAAPLAWPWTKEDTTSGWGQILGDLCDLSVIAAVPITIGCDNGSSGNFTGGNAANGLKVVVYYSIESVP